MKTTLPERSEEFAEQLARITDVIRELVAEDLAMVVLFGSFARGDWVHDKYIEDRTIYEYESDFDLLIVTEGRANATAHGEARLADAVCRRLEKRHLDRPSSSIIVEDIAHLNKYLRRGNYFFVDIKKEGVSLYDNGKHTLVEAEPLPPAEAQQYAREDFEHWYKSASSFLLDFQHAFDRDDTSIAAFYLHQATERFLTAVILGFGQHKAKTHDLEKLDRQVCNLHADFFTVFPRGDEQQKRHFELLKKAYIDARYKRDFVITREELEYLAARVRKLQELAKRICEEHIAAMG